MNLGTAAAIAQNTAHQVERLHKLLLRMRLLTKLLRTNKLLTLMLKRKLLKLLHKTVQLSRGTSIALELLQHVSPGWGAGKQRLIGAR